MAVHATGLVFLCFLVYGIPGSASYAESETQVTSSNRDNLTSETENSNFQDVLDSMQMMGLEVLQNETEVSVSARMKMSDFMFNPVMLVPQLIMWGFAPILLANLKMFVMQALMLNKMALSSAIFMTLRNIVFGPRPGPIVKYANYGYGHGQNKFYHYHKAHKRS